MHSLRYFVFNLLGNGLPLLIALAAVPAIAHYGGVERLGELGIVLGMVGYLGFLDFGLSRVVTRRFALAVQDDRLDDELTELRGFLWWWALPGLLAITLLLIGAQWVAGPYLPEKLSSAEMQRCWIWIVLCIPLTMITNWLRGALEGMQRFARVNLIRTIFGAWNFAAPALTVLIFPTLDAMIASIALGRLLSCFVHAWACMQVDRAILVGHAPRRRSSLTLYFREGGWMTVSNLIAPLINYADRFIMAALFTASAVAWYVTSQEMMMRALMIPLALSGALFPNFSKASDPSAFKGFFAEYLRSIRIISAIMLPLCAFAALLSYDALRLWMGETFAQHGHRIVEIIAIGIFMNSTGFLGLAWLQGTGRSHIAARIHMVQFPLYAACLYVAMKTSGIEGAAWMWTARVGLDCLTLLLVGAREGRRLSISIVLGGASFIMLAGYLADPNRDWRMRMGLAAIGGTLSLLTAWLGLLNREDRNGIGRLRHAN